MCSLSYRRGTSGPASRSSVGPLSGKPVGAPSVCRGAALRKQNLAGHSRFLPHTQHGACFLTLKPHTWMFSGRRCEGYSGGAPGLCGGAQAPSAGSSSTPREVEEGAECSDLCREAHDADDQPDESSPRRTGFLHPVLQSDGVALDRPLPAEGFFLAPPPASPRVLFLTLCFLNAAPRLYLLQEHRHLAPAKDTEAKTRFRR